MPGHGYSSDRVWCFGMGGYPMGYKNLQAVVEAFRSYIFRRQWSILAEKALQNGMQLVVTDNKTRVTIDCYTNGNALIQGPPGILKTDLYAWWVQRRAQI